MNQVLEMEKWDLTNVKKKGKYHSGERGVCHRGY